MSRLNPELLKQARRVLAKTAFVQIDPASGMTPLQGAPQGGAPQGGVPGAPPQGGMPAGQMQGGMPPGGMQGMDPSMMGGMDPSMTGGMDPSMMGGMDPSAMGGGQAPVIQVGLGDLIQLVTMLTGQTPGAPGQPAQTANEQAPNEPKKKSGKADVEGRLQAVEQQISQIAQALGLGNGSSNMSALGGPSSVAAPAPSDIAMPQDVGGGMGGGMGGGAGGAPMGMPGAPGGMTVQAADTFAPTKTPREIEKEKERPELKGKTADEPADAVPSRGSDQKTSKQSVDRSALQISRILRNLQSVVIVDDFDNPILVAQRMRKGLVVSSKASDQDFKQMLTALGIGLNTEYKVTR